jgi:hypothetical protein
VTRNVLLVDLGIAIVAAIIVLLLTPGLAIAALIAILVLIACAISFRRESRRARTARASRRNRKRGPRPREVRPPSRSNRTPGR